MSESIDTSHAPQHVDHPAAWRGEELLGRDDWQWSLSDAEVDELVAAVEHTIEQGISLEAIDRKSFPLPSLAPRLEALQHSLEHGSGATMIRGLPLERFADNEDNDDCDRAKRMFLGLCQHLGTPISQSAAGERVFSVRDEGYAKDDPRARGPNTAKRLSFHTDRCDVIAFLCLKQAKAGGENQLVSSIALYNTLMRERPDLAQQLMQPYYYKRHNVDTGNARPWCRQPIFSFTDGQFAGSMLRVLIERAYAMPELPDMTPLQREALDTLEAVADRDAMHVTFTQAPGDMLFLNNWVTLHRRTAFEDYDDIAERRHILRVWLSMPNSRPLHELFRDNYGAVEAGAIRGGMTAAS